MGRAKGKLKKIVCMDTKDLLQIRTLNAAAQKEKNLKIGHCEGQGPKTGRSASNEKE